MCLKHCTPTMCTYSHCMYSPTHTMLHTHTHNLPHTHKPDVHTHTHTHTHTQTSQPPDIRSPVIHTTRTPEACVRGHTHTHTHTHIYKNTRTHTNTHTHTRMRGRPLTRIAHAHCRLHAAAQCPMANLDRHKQLITMLLEEGADTTQKNAENNTPVGVLYKPHKEVSAHSVLTQYSLSSRKQHPRGGALQTTQRGQYSLSTCSVLISVP